MARKSTKYLELSAYGLNYDCKNLFDEEYGDNKRTESMIYEEINALQSNNIYESLKLGRNLLELLNNDIRCVNFDRTLKRLLKVEKILAKQGQRDLLILTAH